MTLIEVHEPYTPDSFGSPQRETPYKYARSLLEICVGMLVKLYVLATIHLAAIHTVRHVPPIAHDRTPQRVRGSAVLCDFAIECRTRPQHIMYCTFNRYAVGRLYGRVHKRGGVGLVLVPLLSLCVCFFG